MSDLKVLNLFLQHFKILVPDSTDLMARAYEKGSNAIGNSIYSVTFDQKMLEDHRSGERLVPLFGAKYMFHLDGVVDCPEFLVSCQ